MKSFIRNHPLVTFFVLAFLFSWIAVLPRILNPTLPLEPFQIFGALAGPTLSAVIVIAVLEGRKGLGSFFKRYIQWRAGIFWWLFMLFGVLISLTLVATLFLGMGVLTEFISNIGLILPTYLITLIVGIFLGPLWEEPGWRGFALPRLQAQYGPLLGTVILGVLWALWHLPGYPGGWMKASLIALILTSISFSIVMTWVYNNTRGSILLMILLHSSSNAALSVGARVLPTDLTGTMNNLVYGGWVPVITYSIIAIIVLAATRGRLSCQKSEPVPAVMDMQPTTQS